MLLAAEDIAVFPDCFCLRYMQTTCFALHHVADLSFWLLLFFFAAVLQ